MLPPLVDLFAGLLDSAPVLTAKADDTETEASLSVSAVDVIPGPITSVSDTFAELGKTVHELGYQEPGLAIAFGIIGEHGGADRQRLRSKRTVVLVKRSPRSFGARQTIVVMIAPARPRLD